MAYGYARLDEEGRQTGTTPRTNAARFHLTEQDAPDTKDTLTCGNRTQRDSVRRNRAAWHEGQGFESLTQRNVVRIAVFTLTSRTVTAGWGVAGK